MARDRERCALICLKTTQLALSFYFVYSLYALGAFWVIMTACIAVPIYGIFLIAKAPTHTLNHPLVYIRYRALLENRGRIRVDLVISATMSFILFFFSLLLLFGYFHVHSIGLSFLMSAMAALLLSFLFLVNTLVDARQLQMAKIEFINWNYPSMHEKGLFATEESRRSPVEENADFLSITSPMPAQRQGANGHYTAAHNGQETLLEHLRRQEAYGNDSGHKMTKGERGSTSSTVTYDEMSFQKSGSSSAARDVGTSEIYVSSVALPHATAEVIEVTVPAFEKLNRPSSPYMASTMGGTYSAQPVNRSAPYRVGQGKAVGRNTASPLIGGNYSKSTTPVELEDRRELREEKSSSSSSTPPTIPFSDAAMGRAIDTRRQSESDYEISLTKTAGSSPPTERLPYYSRNPQNDDPPTRRVIKPRIIDRPAARDRHTVLSPSVYSANERISHEPGEVSRTEL